MTPFRKAFRWLWIFGIPLFVGLILAGVSSVRAEPPPFETSHLLFSSAAVRESGDQSWVLQIRGDVPSLAGCYVLVHDARGKLILKRHIPHGNYTDAHPLDLTIPKDGWAGDYRVIVVGREADVLGLNLPLSTLNLEVYSGTLFATRSPGNLWFLAEAGESPQEFVGTSGAVRILRDGKPVTGSLEPGKLYALGLGKTFYFQATPGTHLSFWAERNFLPTAELNSICWWQLTNSSSPSDTPQ